MEKVTICYNGTIVINYFEKDEMADKIRTYSNNNSHYSNLSPNNEYPYLRIAAINVPIRVIC